MTLRPRVDGGGLVAVGGGLRRSERPRLSVWLLGWVSRSGWLLRSVELIRWVWLLGRVSRSGWLVHAVEPHHPVRQRLPLVGAGRERGMVTAELAAAMPVAAGLTVLAVGLIGVGIDQIRCVDAARVGARALARGDPATAVSSAVRSVAPTGAALVLGGDDRTVSVTVRVVRSLPGGWGSFDLEARSSADRELPHG